LPKSVKEQQNEAATVKPATAPGHVDFADTLTSNPLLVQSTAAMAAATAVGLSLAGQFAGAFFGALQGALEAQRRFSGDAEAEVAPSRTAPREELAAASSAPAKPQARTRRKPVGQQAPAAAKAGGTKPTTRRSAKTVAKDNLKQISGVGPKLEKVLNENGITALSQIAAWNETEVAKFDKLLGLDGRIGRDDWVGQAGKLAK
jgi:NADH-quinone oxidoreductase subunit E